MISAARWSQAFLVPYDDGPGLKEKNEGFKKTEGSEETYSKNALRLGSNPFSTSFLTSSLDPSTASRPSLLSLSLPALSLTSAGHSDLGAPELESAEMASIMDWLYSRVSSV